MKFYVDLVWNREFGYYRYGDSHNTLESAIAAAESIQNSGDGARVKKVRVIDEDGKVVWAFGKMVSRK